MVAAVAVLLAAAAVPRTALAGGRQEPVRLLDVPYLAQSEALCGGAAAAMVMRYWGQRAVYADAFADLVDAQAGGIRGEDLLRALADRGWRASSFRGDSIMVARHLGQRRPVVALIEDSPTRFHYVVIVGWSDGHVVAHDPARSPFRIYDEAAFLRAWSKSGYWAMLAMPDPRLTGTSSEPPPEASSVEGRCGAMVTEGVRLAHTGAIEQAGRLLALALDACPDDAAPRRELAGVHALKQEWKGAALRAREALERDPADAHAIRILATSLFLVNDLEGALDAWNLIGEPAVDLVVVSGLERTRYGAVASLLRMEAQGRLTTTALRQARRRLGELPGAAAGTVTYAPAEDGRAEVNAAIVERPLVPSGVTPLGIIAARGLVDRGLTVTLANPTGGGETLTTSWRWWSRRPRAALVLRTPAPIAGVGGVWRIEVFHDQQTYAPAGNPAAETRRGAAFTTSDWVAGRWRWELGAGVDRWRGRGTAANVSGALALHSRRDRWAVSASGSFHAGALEAAAASVRADWQSTAAREGTVWHLRAGADAASHGAPFALWPGAGVGHARDALLRAHPLLDEGVVRAGVFGRRLAHGGAEWRHWFESRLRLWRVAPAILLDVARAACAARGYDDRLHVDAGAGIRVALPAGGTLRLDVGRGLRDGAMAVSAGWTR
jgi:hypothetical protein